MPRKRSAERPGRRSRLVPSTLFIDVGCVLPLEDSFQYGSLRSVPVRSPRLNTVVPFPAPALDPRLVIAITETLRAMDAEVARQPVPERLLHILHALEMADEESRS